MKTRLYILAAFLCVGAGVGVGYALFHSDPTDPVTITVEKPGKTIYLPGNIAPDVCAQSPLSLRWSIREHGAGWSRITVTASDACKKLSQEWRINYPAASGRDNTVIAGAGLFYHDGNMFPAFFGQYIRSIGRLSVSCGVWINTKAQFYGGFVGAGLSF